VNWSSPGQQLAGVAWLRSVVFEVPGIAVDAGEENTTVAVEVVQLSSDLRKQRRRNYQLLVHLPVLNEQLMERRHKFNENTNVPF
jgi:hypothetical protein